MQRPESLATRGARFAALLAYSNTTLADLAHAYGDEAVVDELIRAAEYVRALRAEAAVHGDLRADLSRASICERAGFIEECEAPALMWLASVGYMPQGLDHLRLLAYRLGRLTEDAPDYVARVEQQLRAAEAAERARRALQSVGDLHGK